MCFDEPALAYVRGAYSIHHHALSFTIVWGALPHTVEFLHWLAVQGIASAIALPFQKLAERPVRTLRCALAARHGSLRAPTVVISPSAAPAGASTGTVR